MNPKKLIRRLLEKRLDKIYESKLKRYIHNYSLWMEELEKKKSNGPQRGKKVEFELLIFGNGVLAEKAKERFASYFAAYPQAQIVYADEDMIAEDGTCHNPWLKPDWSPDSYLYRDYLGSVVAVRKDIYDKLTQQEKEEEGICHDRLVELAGGYNRGCNTIGHLQEVGFHRKEEWKLPGESRAGIRPYHPKKKIDKPMVSVIIPSKDNVAVLQQCVGTVLKTVINTDYEIIIVDNGSSMDARILIEAELEKINQDLTNKGCLKKTSYIYEPMEFNFSLMCNLGAKKAAGNILLFLNDDIEALKAGWLEDMVEKAREPWVGAVGIKLWYPDSNRIQHAGVVNITIGPIHKLQFLKDNKCYYDGRNKGIWNSLAVTGACMMIRKETFAEAGGFFEELKVAFNDVDICYTLYDMGYHNVVINTRHMMHHESLSRGNDDSEIKQQRLKRERDLLYDRHPRLEGRDPYYHPWLNSSKVDTAIKPAFVEGRTFKDTGDYEEEADLQKARRDDCLMLGIEYASADRIQGYAVVLGSNNACYTKKLLFQSKDERDILYQLKFLEQYRSDIQDNMPDQKNVALSGFRIKLKRKLPKGKYRIGVLAEDRISGLRLYNWSSGVLIV